MVRLHVYNNLPSSLQKHYADPVTIVSAVNMLLLQYMPNLFHGTDKTIRGFSWIKWLMALKCTVFTIVTGGIKLLLFEYLYKVFSVI